MTKHRERALLLAVLYASMCALPAAAERFNVNGNGTVTDVSTGLMWMQSPTVNTSAWSNALAACENASFAGYQDWRLPNIKELFSIYDLTRSGPALDGAVFSISADLYNGRYPYEASSTSSSSSSTLMLCVSVSTGQVTVCAKTTGFLSQSYGARCVR